MSVGEGKTGRINQRRKPTTYNRPPKTALTSKQLAVLRMVSEGLTREQVADKLFISTSTVKGHLQRVCGFLRAANTVNAVAIAYELGILGGQP